MAYTPAFALFILIENVDITWLNQSLERAWEGDVEAGWDFWIATDNYDDIPKERDDNMVCDGTQPPLPQDLTSPWAGKSILDCGKWLHRMPGNVGINRGLFAVITEHSKADDTFASCKIDTGEDGDSQGIDVEYIPQKIDEVGIQFVMNGGIKFYEKADGYRAVCMLEGRPDRSHIRA